MPNPQVEEEGEIVQRVMDQKNYVEELNRSLKINIANIQVIFLQQRYSIRNCYLVSPRKD